MAVKVILCVLQSPQEKLVPESFKLCGIFLLNDYLGGTYFWILSHLLASLLFVH